MKQKTLFVTMLLMAALILAACGAAQTPETAAPPAEPLNTAPPEASATLPQPTDAPTSAPLQTETPVEEPTAVVESTTSSAAAEPGSGQQFTIVAGESEARFLIDEVLFGAPKTVVGSTNAVTGTFNVDFAGVTASLLEVEVDLRTLVTDNNNRTRAVHNNILHTNQPEFQYARFEGLAFENLPGSVTPGQPFDFQVRGNLTIHGVTQEALFDVTLTPVSETRFEGLAMMTIVYADYDVHILRLPESVASVEDITTLELTFIAEVQN